MEQEKYDILEDMDDDNGKLVRFRVQKLELDEFGSWKSRDWKLAIETEKGWRHSNTEKRWQS